jgi:hypothetical protein
VIGARLLACVALAGAIFAPGAGHAANERFSAGTAHTLPRGALEVGVFAPLRWGATERVEVSVRPLLFFVAPHLEAKVGWLDRGAFTIASSHGLLYPTPLMRLLSREGAGGIVPNDVRYPHILGTRQHLLATSAVGDHLVTARAGGRLARNLTSFDGPRFWSQVEWHLAWPRMAAWFTGWSVDGGIAAEGPLWRTLGYRVELDGFLMPGLRGDRAAEWAAIGTWRPRRDLLVRGGLLWSWAELPYGTRLSVPFPILDAVWSFGGSRSR